ncbi:MULTISPECIES: DUF1643 domain-containing protein [Paenibacillus]|uniref:DUF1643 domain-containing protein n=1 Tax=Paenibacillus TaxID=44249 RepID=UPI0006856731|nr:DUF1643 domain-containing protein [Paenibacillus sp. J14]
MIEIRTATIQSKVIFSNTRKHRYLLERVWDDKKKKATIIMINPSFADELKTDLTVCKLMNFLIDNEFGSLRIVNLYAFISTDPSYLTNNKDAVGDLNDQYILESINDVDLVIIAWGIEKDKYKKRKEQVKKVLQHLNIEVKGFIDSDGRIGRHPSRINNFILEDYSWE